MKAIRVAALVALVAGLAVLVHGCGSEGASSGQSADQLFVQGMASLEQGMSGADFDEEPWEWDVDFSEPLARFEEALDQDPEHCGALFGAAFTRLLVILVDPEIGDALDELYPEEERGGADAFLWCAREPDVLGLAQYLRSHRDDFVFSELQEFMEDEVIPALAIADEWLSDFEELDCTIVITVEIPDSIGWGREEVELELDATDAYFVHAPLDAVQAMAHIVCAYDVDFTEEETLQYLIECDPNFLTLRSGDHMPSAYDELIELAAHLTDACDSLEGETDAQNDDLITETGGLIPLDELVGENAVEEIRAIAEDLHGALVDGLTVNPSDDDPEAPDIDILVDLDELFNDPLPDLRDYFPAHTWPEEDDMDVTRPIVFTDPTFDGITPGMTNAEWEELIQWMEGEFE